MAFDLICHRGTETRGAFNQGYLQELLSRSGVTVEPKKVNACSYLPKRVHPR